MMISKAEGMKRVQSLIKGWLDELERVEGWTVLPPIITNFVRHAIMRVAWGSYKIGLISEKEDKTGNVNA